MAHAGLVSLAEAIEQILNHAHSPIHNLPAANQEIIMSIRDQTVFLQSFLLQKEVDTSLEGRIREVANAAEDVMDDLLLDCVIEDGKLKQVAERFGVVIDYIKKKSNDDWANKINLERPRGDFSFTISREGRLFGTLKQVAERFRVVTDYIKKKGNDDSANKIYTVSWKGRLFGHDKNVKRIRNILRRSSSELKVLPIVGIGGIGKSTLARDIYEDQRIKEYFKVRGWVTVSQDYNVASVVSSLVASIKGSMKFGGGVEELQDHLRGRRYLIVVDDMWSKKAWDDVRKLLPDNDHGSAIILTTRNQDVAAYASPSSYIHVVEPLNLEESWELLKDCALGDEYCPPHLESVGRRIAESCRGLPLSISVVGGLLSKLGFESGMWEKIETSSDGQVEELISLSYTHLPHLLKSCFLYMGGFPEDYEIHASELVRLWVAEGFANNGSEDEAAGYLEDLIDRGLVLCSSPKLDGKVKCCSLHDIVRDFCIKQGRRENILVPVMDYLPTPILRRHFLSLVLQKYKRISTSCNDLHLTMHTSRAHSIICLPQKTGYKRASATSVRSLSLLRVLHVLRKDDYCDWQPSHDVFDLVYLTYLASNISSTIVPPAISKLQNLRTLILYKSEVRLPAEIWGLRRLRHLIAFSFHPLPHPQEEVLPLENLQTVSVVTDFVCSERMVEMIPNVNKLGISYCAELEFDNMRIDDERYLFENLTLLLRLEELKLENCTLFWRQIRWNPVFPKSLKKLVISGGWLSWSDMKLVGSLPRLQVLKLKNYACEGEEWETCDGEFVELRVLVIAESDLQYWISSRYHFPALKRLMLHRCPYLACIPFDLGYIPTLELIEVDEDNERLLYSAKMMQVQKEIEFDFLQVRVKRF